MLEDYVTRDLARWGAMVGRTHLNQGIDSEFIRNARLAAPMAHRVQRQFQAVRGRWFTNYDSVRESVTFRSNEGYYAQVEQTVVKTLDTGHKLSDALESFRISMGKIFQEYEDQSINYDAPWEFSRILPAKSTGLTASRDAYRLVGGHGDFLYPGTYMFVICLDGCIRYFPNNEVYAEEGPGSKHYLQYLPHAALARHAPVLAAGNFCTDVHGRLVWAASNSGHYRVNDNMCRHNLVASLRGMGYEYSIRESQTNQSIKNMDELHQMMDGNRPVNEFMYMHYPAIAAFQDYRKAKDRPLAAQSGVRPKRTPLVTQIKEVVVALHEQIAISKSAILPL